MADLQSTNRVALAKVREATFGVTPPTPAFKSIRQTSSGLAASPQTEVSAEIRPDRQVTDLILVGMQAGGDIGGELSFRSVDDDFEEALQGTWSSKPSIEVVTLDTQISDVSATTLTVAAGLGTPFKANHLVVLTGLPTAANNKVAKVSSATSTTIVFPASTFVAETAPIPVGAAARVVGFAGASADIAAVTIGGNALASTILDFTTLGLHVGEWIRIGGTTANSFFATAGTNGWARIAAISANRLSLDNVPVGFAADVGTGKLIEIYAGDFLVNGSSKRSNTIERQYLDHAPVTFEYLRGQTLDRLSVNAPAQKPAAYSRTYVGADAAVQASRFAGATDIPAPTYPVLNTSSNVGRIGFGGSLLSGPNFVMSAQFEINNNLRRQNAVGSIAAVGIGNGEFSVTGTLETYFGDSSVYQQVINNTLTSYDMRLGRQDGNKESLLFDFPSIKLSGGSPGVSGKNADVMLSAGFTAIMDAVKGYTMSVGRFWFLP
ncbi:phage tail tube protein [Kaistia terrae]|uniref:Phage tail tube protein n=1 Tax=Kaistia terrae TaxID=537017 RepID=A0ABW0Q2N7_9HYPH|nr:phage tail tube protein [Kaistia terrae]MCX5581324.1 phage tail tube protein [Kaistia terrae]